MEVSNEIKEDIRKTQSDLKNAIRIHQVGLLITDYCIKYVIMSLSLFNKVKSIYLD